MSVKHKPAKAINRVIALIGIIQQVAKPITPTITDRLDNSISTVKDGIPKRKSDKVQTQQRSNVNAIITVDIT